MRKYFLWIPLLGLSISCNAQDFLVFQVNNPYKKTNTKLMGTLFWMKHHSDGTIQVKKTFPCAYGMNGVGKQVRGDKRTPLGIYKITQVQRNNDAKRYGNWLLRVNYPNKYDRKKGRTGGGIAIHGGRTLGTLGCMRVLDGSLQYPKMGLKNIKYLAQHLSPNTQVIVCENIKSNLLQTDNGYLTSKAARYWSNNILDKEMNRQSMMALLQSTNTTPTLPPVTYAANQQPNRVPQLVIVNETLIEAGSILQNNKFKYGEQHLCDGNPNTTWATSTQNAKWIKFTYGKKQTFQKIAIQVGYSKSGRDRNGRYYDRWSENSRPSKLKIYFGDGTSEVLSLKDSRKLETYRLQNSHTTKHIKLEIIDYQRGDKYANDICISELSFL